MRKRKRMKLDITIAGLEKLADAIHRFAAVQERHAVIEEAAYTLAKNSLEKDKENNDNLLGKIALAMSTGGKDKH
jgi:hypothetical protein